MGLRADAPQLDVEKELLDLAKVLRNSGDIESAKKCLAVCEASQLRINKYRAVIRKWTEEAADGTCPVCGNKPAANINQCT